MWTSPYSNYIEIHNWQQHFVLQWILHWLYKGYGTNLDVIHKWIHKCIAILLLFRAEASNWLNGVFLNGRVESCWIRMDVWLFWHCRINAIYIYICVRCPQISNVYLLASRRERKTHQKLAFRTVSKTRTYSRTRCVYYHV